MTKTSKVLPNRDPCEDRGLLGSEKVEVLRAVLPIELTNGNDGRGCRWFRSAKVRDDLERILRALRHVREPFDFPVSLTVTRILGPRQKLWDVSSCGRGNWKELEDALVACGWFHDDGPRWIESIAWEQDGTQRKNGPAVEITVYRQANSAGGAT